VLTDTAQNADDHRTGRRRVSATEPPSAVASADVAVESVPQYHDIGPSAYAASSQAAQSTDFPQHVHRAEVVHWRP
jgi:hypothetical protein